MVTRPPVPYMDYLVPGLLLSFSAAACSFFISTLVQPQNAGASGGPALRSAGLEGIALGAAQNVKSGPFWSGDCWGPHWFEEFFKVNAQSLCQMWTAGYVLGVRSLNRHVGVSAGVDSVKPGSTTGVPKQVILWPGLARKQWCVAWLWQLGCLALVASGSKAVPIKRCKQTSTTSN